MSSKTKALDLTSVSCRKCKQGRWRMCIRLSGYGIGNTLRRVHQERREDAIEAHKQEVARARARA